MNHPHLFTIRYCGFIHRQFVTYAKVHHTMDIRLARGFTLEEALQMAYADDVDVEQIFVEPPEVNILTDEEPGDEEETPDINHLPGRQLAAAAEIVLHNNNRMGLDYDDVESNDDDLASGDSLRVSNDSKEIPPKICKQFSWVEGDFHIEQSNFPNPDFSQFQNLTAVKMFENFFDDEVINFLIGQSRIYASFKNYPDPKISYEEMKCAIGILILSGYHPLPSKRDYWDSKNDMKNLLVSESMRRNRFLSILQFLHCADNQFIDENDKLWKMRPFMNLLKSKFLSHFVPEEGLSYDESMIKYFGRHGCKQFIRGKPIRFGFKMWCLNSKNGYLLNFDMYQGKDPNSDDICDKSFGKAAAPLVRMIREMPNDKKILRYKFYFDNLFTSMSLLNFLRENGYGSTGTFRENRLPKNCPLPSKNRMLKENQRGDYFATIDKETGVMVARWVDNGVVTVASTCHGIQPLGNAKRYCRSEKKSMQVPMPSLIRHYNNNMAGTDLMDENINRFRTSIRIQKWWWVIFTWLLDAAIENAWILYKNSGNPITQKNFRREIANLYLSRYGTPSRGAGRPATSLSSVTLNRTSDDLRYDGLNHLLVPIPNKKRRRCAGEGFISSIRTMCKKCNVGLCIECNFVYHTN